MDASLRWHDGLEHWRAMTQRDPGSGAGVTEERVPLRIPSPNSLLARNESRFILASPGCVANICC